jgi:hypothetical protein
MAAEVHSRWVQQQQQLLVVCAVHVNRHKSAQQTHGSLPALLAGGAQ